ncbi:MAG: peptidase, partial [Leeuwenhoekiella sp.]
KQKGDYRDEIQRTINHNVIKHLKNLYINKKATAQVKARVFNMLTSIADDAKSKKGVEGNYIAASIEQFFKGPEKFEALPSPKIPDGSPIGSFQCTID